MAHQLSEHRIAAIRRATPSEAAIARSIREGARTREEAIERAHQRRIETAECHARGEHYGSNSGHRIIPFADCLTPEQRDIAGAGLPKSTIQAARDARPGNPYSAASVQRAAATVVVERRRQGRAVA